MKNLFICTLILCSFSAVLVIAQSVGINTMTPDASAALDIVSTSQGMLDSRMNAEQRTGIASPTVLDDDVFVMNQMGMGVPNPTYRIYIENNATLALGHARATAWSTYIEARVKTNVTSILYLLKEVMALRSVPYNHHSSTFDTSGLIDKDDYSHVIGFIAQEVHTIVSEIVAKPSNESNDFWSMDYEKQALVLVNANQE